MIPLGLTGLIGAGLIADTHAGRVGIVAMLILWLAAQGRKTIRRQVEQQEHHDE